MKKFFMYAVAAVATMSLTSCLSEEETNLTNGEKGYINLNVTAENELITRADAPSTWIVNLGGAETKSVTVGTLSSTPLTPGAYTVNVSSHTSLDAALTGYGEAYYTGNLGKTGDVENTVTVTTGTPVNASIACGKAKNAKLTIETAVPSDAVLNITVSNGSRNLTFNKTSETTLDHTSAFFEAGEELTIGVSYTIYGHSGTLGTNAKKLTLGGAGTENKISISSNQTGTITLTSITYDDTFSDGNTQTITFDAATGAVLNVTNSNE